MSTTTREVSAPARPSRGLAAALDWATASHLRAVALLLGFAALAFLPGFFQIPPVDRDEARFAQATKQMLETGEYVDIHFQDEVRYKKPVGIYWLQAAAVKAGGVLGVSQARTTIWLYRLPSLFGAIGAVLLTYWAALAFVTRRSALLASLMMASSVLLGVEARLAKTDAVLLFTCVIVMGAMARLYLASRRQPDDDTGWGLPALMWTAAGVSVLIKGPLILMFIGLTALALSIADRSGRWIWRLKPVVGFVWMVLLVLPWVVAIVAKSGDSFFVQALGHDMLDKVTSGQEAHGAPPGMYLLLFFITFWPGSVLAAPAVPAIWQARREPGARFLLAWLVPSWIVFEIVITKLPHYVLPLYPAIAILIAGILEAGALAKYRWMIRGTVGWFLFPAVISLVAVVAFVIFNRELGLLAWPTAAVAVILVTPIIGLLSDRFGRKPALLSLAALSAVLPVSMFSLMAGSSTARALTGAVVLALVAGGVSAVGAIATGEQFGERSRASGLGLGYTIATAVFGGLTPYVAQRLVETTGSPLMPGIMIAAVAVAALPVFALMRETAPRRG